MTLLQYYLFANIYLLAFWLFYRLSLRKLTWFRSIRIYLISAVTLSSILPFIQISLAQWLEPAMTAGTTSALPIVGIVYDMHVTEVLPVNATSSFNWISFSQKLLIAGSLITALIYAYMHHRIMKIINESRYISQLKNGLRVLLSTKVKIPCIYFKQIIIPVHAEGKDHTQIIGHEVLHHRHLHHLDNLLYSILHMVFWANPVFFLLRRALKLTHEYEVDQCLLSNGTDPVSYKLSLVKYSVGPSLFSLANGLSACNTKNRIMMINRIPNTKGKWRYLLLIPLFTLLFATLACSQIETQSQNANHEALIEDSSENLREVQDTMSIEDTLRVQIIDPYTLDVDMKEVWSQRGTIMALMNRKNQMMIAGKVVAHQEVEQRIISIYNDKLEESTNFDIKVVVSRDIAADDAEYQKFLDAIGSALFKLRDMQSIKLYGGLFSTLKESEKTSIDKLIPLIIYAQPPKNVTGMDTPPLFHGKEKDEFMHYILRNLEYPETIADSGIAGRVVVEVEIKADGSIGDVSVLESIHPDLDNELIRVVKSSPKWTPATKHWKKVSAKLQFSANFVLQ